MCGLAQQNISVAWIRLKYDFNRLIKAEFLLRIRQKAVHQLLDMGNIAFSIVFALMHVH